MNEDNEQTATDLYDDIRAEAKHLMEDVQSFSSRMLAGDPASMGEALSAGAAFGSRGAHISAVTAIQTANLNRVAADTLDEVTRVSQAVQSTLTQVDAVAKDARRTSERVERLHQPRGLFLLGLFIVLSNAVVAAAVIGIYFAGAAIFSKVDLSPELAIGITSGLIVFLIGSALTAVTGSIRKILKPQERDSAP